MPDAELLRLADRQALRQPGVLEAQVKRLIADPKSRALVDNFGGQWLELRRLESVTPDTQRFPAWDEYLRISIRRETELLLQNVLAQDRPLTELIDADYTFLNERLARFYRDSGCNRTGLPARPTEGQRQTRRNPDPGERADGLVVCDSHFAGAAREVDS
jgi:hypothetical protein